MVILDGVLGMGTYGKFISPALLVSAMLALAHPADGAELRIEVIGLRSPAGVVRLALYSSPEDFPDDDKQIASKQVEINGQVSKAVFMDLTPGTYAVAVYHDENSNDKFDRGFFGLPLEGYGFSNNAPVFLSAPEFAAAAVALKEGGSNISVTITY